MSKDVELAGLLAGLLAVGFVLTLLVTDILYRAVDPRVSLK